MPGRTASHDRPSGGAPSADGGGAPSADGGASAASDVVAPGLSQASSGSSQLYPPHPGTLTTPPPNGGTGATAGAVVPTSGGGGAAPTSVVLDPPPGQHLPRPRPLKTEVKYHFDTSKIPEIYDNIYYDLTHRREELEQIGVIDVAEKIFNLVLPVNCWVTNSEFGLSVQENWGGNGLSASARFQTSFRPVSDRFQTSAANVHIVPVSTVSFRLHSPCYRVMSGAQSHVGRFAEKSPVGFPQCHFGYALVLTEIQESGPKVVQY